MKKQLCLYCKKEYHEGGREHVFPKGLGGPAVYLDNVCEDCNSKFSKFELSLMRESPVAFSRSVKGLEGYHRTNGRPSPFRAPILFSFDSDRQVVYEIGQHYPLQNFVRPQVLLIRNRFYIEGDTQDGVKKLVRLFNIWKRDVRYVGVRVDASNDNKLSWIEFVDKGSYFESRITEKSDEKKGQIKVSVLSVNHELYKFLSPRVFLDDSKGLRIRARTNEEAIAFLSKLMQHTRNAVSMDSFNRGEFDHPIVYVGQNFSQTDFLQAMVKIGLNCIMHYFPTFRNDAALKHCISFLLDGSPILPVVYGERNPLKDSSDETHSIFFQQTGQGMHVRVGLFGGTGGAFSYLINGLMILAPGDFRRLLIDYNLRTMDLQNREDYLRSFPR